MSTWISYALYAIGWGLGLVGKLYGVAGLAAPLREGYLYRLLRNLSHAAAPKLITRIKGTHNTRNMVESVRLGNFIAEGNPKR